MAPSLKERYDRRLQQSLQERARAADAQLLAEQKAAQLLLEAMDEQDLQKVSAIIDKLNTLKAPELPSLSAAIEQAQAELNKYTGGGPLRAAWTKLMTKLGADNPVVKITTFADALERGFSQIPTILKNNGVDLSKADLSKSLSSTLLKQPTGASGGEGGMKSDVTGTAGNKEKTDIPKPAGTTGAKSDTQLGSTSFTGTKSGTKADDDYSIPGPEPKAPTPARQPPEPKHNGGQDQPPKQRPGIAPRPPQKGSKASEPTDKEKERAAFNPKERDWFKKGQAEGEDLDEANPIGWAKDKLGIGKAPKEVSGEEKLKNITAQIRKALAPGGLFGAFKKVPYIDGSALTQELIQAPIKVFANVAKRAQQGAKAADIAPKMKDQIQGQGDEQTKAANTAEPSKPAAQTQPGQPGKPTTATTGTTGTGEQPPVGPGQARGGGAEVKNQKPKTGAQAQNFRAGLDRIYKGSGIRPEDGQKLLKYLINNNLVDRSAIETHGTSGGTIGKPSAA